MTNVLSYRRFLAAVEKVFPAFTRNYLRSAYTGLEGLDRRLIKIIQPRKGGYFVELGANDGVRQSNTYKLQKSFNWTGLLIEPSPRQFLACLRNRSFGRIPSIKCAACVPFGFPDKFIEIDDLDLMAVAKGLTLTPSLVEKHTQLGVRFLHDHRVRHCYGALARTLTSLLEEVGAPKEIDLLSLDVEGNELAVLQGLDFSRYQPRWLLAEVYGQEIVDYICLSGYTKMAILSDHEIYRDVLFLSTTAVGSHLPALE